VAAHRIGENSGLSSTTLKSAELVVYQVNLICHLAIPFY